MERKYLIYSVLIVCAIFLFSGCGTVPKKFKEEVGGIKTRVETLESRVEGVETKQAESERIASEQAQAMEEMKGERVKTNISVKSRVGKGRGWTKEIQTCLKNAGFYNGKIDGIKGKNTKKAIKEFQKANGLTPDGIAGKKTWELLSRYSAGPAAQGTSGTEEGPTK